MKGEERHGGTTFVEYTFEETYPDGSKHYCGEHWPTLKQCRTIMEVETKWLKEQIKIHRDDEETLRLRQSQLDTIRIVQRTVTISDWE